MYSARGISVDSAFARRIETRGRDRPGQVRRGQVRTGQVRTAQVRTRVSILRAKAESTEIPRAEYT